MAEGIDLLKLPKVELHVHLVGTVRATTLWELAQGENIRAMDSILSADDLKKKLSLDHLQDYTMKDYLKPYFRYIYRVLAGDAAGLEKVAFQFCEDASQQNIVYSEVRYSPHLLSERKEPGGLTPIKGVILAINRGLDKGCMKFGVKVKTILCCVRKFPAWSKEVLSLCEEFQGAGVVGIDLTGSEEQNYATEQDVEAFQLPEKKNIYRTAHTAEHGPASNVKIAIDELHVDRIGHGYHVVEDMEMYKYAKEKKIHIEACPYSSKLTGSVRQVEHHPIQRFAEDQISFSLSRDDPAIIQKSLIEEYNYARELGLTYVDIARANLNAARCCFLQNDQKRILVKEIVKAWNILDEDV